MERILQSRRLGFVEVVPVDTTWLAYGPDIFDTRSKRVSAVRFIHRSAVEFLRLVSTPFIFGHWDIAHLRLFSEKTLMCLSWLSLFHCIDADLGHDEQQQPKTWSHYILDWKDASFEPSLALLCSAIHTLKRLQLDNTLDSVGTIRSMALYAGCRALDVEQLTKKACPTLLLELNRVMDIQVSRPDVQVWLNIGSGSLRACVLCKSTHHGRCPSHWSKLCFEFSPRSRTTFLSFAASLQLRYFIQHQVTCHGPKIANQEQDSLLAYVEEAGAVDPELVKFLKGLSRRAVFSKERVLRIWSSKKSKKRELLGQPITSSGA